MKKKLSLLMAMIMVISLAVIPGFGAVPLDTALAMYANGSDTGNPTAFIITESRTHPENAYGPFDAVQNAGENLFYSLASHEYTEFTFGSEFFNIEDTDEVTDMEFSEVTWGDSWHPEAALVFLKGAKIGTYNENVVYDSDFEDYGYFAGIIWNKVGLQELSEGQRDSVVQDYAELYGVVSDDPEVESRIFIANTYGINGNFGITHFKMPEEVVSANAVVLVDITSEVYNLTDSSTRTNSYNTGKDGYDLDAIRVYGFDPTVISGVIDGFKYDLSGNPITDETFEFEIYAWVDDAKGDLVAKAQSNDVDGSFDFSKPEDFDNFNEESLDLPIGIYYIEEVNIPFGYEFVSFTIDGDLAQEQDDGALFVITPNTTNMSVIATNQKLSNFKAYKFNGAMEEEVGFMDFSFDFVLRKIVDEIPMDYATGHSLKDGSGMIVWDLIETEEVEMLEELMLPEGYYEMYEYMKDGFMLVGTKLITQGMNDPEPIELPGDKLTVPFMVMEGDSVMIKYANEMTYYDETAYAYFDEDSIQLNTLRKNNNWGWYIETEDLMLETPYEIYAGAGQNILENGVMVGTVTFYTDMDGMYHYMLDFSGYPGEIDPFVVEEHFGVYATADEIPKGPGLFTNLIPADEAGVLVLHLVVSIPNVMPE